MQHSLNNTPTTEKLVASTEHFGLGPYTFMGSTKIKTFTVYSTGRFRAVSVPELGSATQDYLLLHKVSFFFFL